jgi:hypothetical protein
MSTLKVGTIQDHANSNTAITIDSSGRVAHPQRPYLFAQRGVSNGAITPTGFTGKVPYNFVLGSSGISLDTTTSLITVPITGLYQINGAVRIQANRTFVYWAVVDDNGGNPQVLPDADGGNNIVLCHGQDAGFTTAAGACSQILRTGKSYFIRANDSAGTATTVQTSQTWLQMHFVG